MYGLWNRAEAAGALSMLNLRGCREMLGTASPLWQTRVAARLASTHVPWQSTAPQSVWLCSPLH